MKIRKLLFGLMFVLFWVQNGVQAEPAQEFVLKNGMKVVVREDHRAPGCCSYGLVPCRFDG